MSSKRAILVHAFRIDGPMVRSILSLGCPCVVETCVRRVFEPPTPSSPHLKPPSSTFLPSNYFVEQLFNRAALMLPKTRKWFTRRLKKLDDSRDQTDALAMSGLAESLQNEIQGLNVEIRTLRKKREQLFCDIHDIMLSKSQAQNGSAPCPPYDSPPSQQPLPTLRRRRSSQTLWFPNPLTASISESSGVEMGLFGPRSRAPSLTSQTQPTMATKPSDIVETLVPDRPRRLRSASDGEPVKNIGESTMPTRTAWRTVNRRSESINV